MAPLREQATLFPSPQSDRGGTVVVVNERCQVRSRDGRRVVVVGGTVIAQYAVGDRMSEALAMVNLVEQGFAEQEAVARAFGCAARTVRRYQERFDAGGLAALGRGGGYPKGRARLRSSRARTLLRLKAGGLSNRAIAQRQGVSEKAIRKRLRRLGWRQSEPVQVELPLEPAGTEAAASVPLEASGSADPNLSASPAQALSRTDPGLLTKRGPGGVRGRWVKEVSGRD